MTGHGEKLTRKQEAAIAALVELPTITAVAARVGVNERTIRRWLLVPTFQAEYRKARRRLVDTAVAGLQRLSRRAVLALGRNLRCGRPGDEIRAAATILEFCFKASADELEERLARLEELAAAQRNGQPSRAFSRNGEQRR